MPVRNSGVEQRPKRSRGSLDASPFEISNRAATVTRPNLRSARVRSTRERRFPEIRSVATGNIIQIIPDHHRSSRKSLDGWTRMNQRGLFKAYQGPDPAESVRRVTRKSNISIPREDRRRAYKYVPTLEPTALPPSAPLTA